MAAPAFTIVNNPDPANYAASVVINTPFAVCRALYVGAAGNATLVMPDATEVEFKGLVAGTILPVRCTNVKSGATAADFVALY